MNHNSNTEYQRGCRKRRRGGEERQNKFGYKLRRVGMIRGGRGKRLKQQEKCTKYEVKVKMNRGRGWHAGREVGLARDKDERNKYDEEMTRRKRRKSNMIKRRTRRKIDDFVRC